MEILRIILPLIIVCAVVVYLILSLKNRQVKTHLVEPTSTASLSLQPMKALKAASFTHQQA